MTLPAAGLSGRAQDPTNTSKWTGGSKHLGHPALIQNRLKRNNVVNLRGVWAHAADLTARNPTAPIPVVPSVRPSILRRDGTMNWLDIVILIIVGVGAFMGLKMGVIRAGLTTLGIFVGSILGGQLSDDIGGIFSGIDSESAVATVLSYAIIISISLTAAAIAATILRKVVYVLFLGWADKLAGVALGVVAGSVISAAVIMGMANLTYGSEVGDELAGKILNSTLDTEQAKKRMEDGLTRSALVDVFIDVVDIVPASTLWFVPSNFKSSLDVLDRR